MSYILFISQPTVEPFLPGEHPTSLGQLLSELRSGQVDVFYKKTITVLDM